MAIKIKRSTGNLAPAELAAGQLAYVEGSENGGTLYYGEIGGTVREIAGRKYVDKLNGIEAGAQVNVIEAVVDDTTPQLGGALDVNGNSIVSTANGNIALSPDGTGQVRLNSSTVGLGNPSVLGTTITNNNSGAFTFSNSSSSLTLSAGTNLVFNPGSTNGVIQLRHGSNARVQVGIGGNVGHITTPAADDLLISTNNNSNSGTIRIVDGVDGEIQITPNGAGKIVLDGASWPNALGTAGQFLQTDAAGVLSWATVDTSISSSDVTTALGFTPENSANKGAANGYASLDANGLVPSTQLPSYVDDVLEFADLAAFPATGETGKIYVAIDSGLIYRWSGSVYIEISPSPGTTDSVAEGTTNLYFTQARARGSISAGGDLSYDSATGVISYNAPTLATVATSGSYDDLTDKPTIPDVSSFITAVEDDTAPKLGGSLDVNGNAITTSVTNGNIELTANGNGIVRSNSGFQAPVIQSFLNTFGTGSSSIFQWQAYDNSNLRPISFAKSRGTTLSPTALQTNDIIYNQNILGHDGQTGSSGLETVWQHIVRVTDTPSNDFVPSENLFNIATSANTRTTYASVGTDAVFRVRELGLTGDLSNFVVRSRADGNIQLIPDGTGHVEISGLAYPTADGSAGQVLTTDGSGTLSWSTASGGLTAVEDDTAPKLGGDLDVNNKKITTSVTNGNVLLEANGNGQVILQSDSTMLAFVTVDVAEGGTALIGTGSAGIDAVEKDSTDAYLRLYGPFIQLGDLGNEITINGYAIWPSTDGTAGQVLTTDGSGTLSWSTASGFSGSYNDLTDKPTLVTAFTGLSDTPSAFTGAAGHYVKVNSGATALEFSQDIDDGTF